jgi:hypothetical protein
MSKEKRESINYLINEKWGLHVDIYSKEDLLSLYSHQAILEKSGLCLREIMIDKFEFESGLLGRYRVFSNEGSLYKKFRNFEKRLKMIGIPLKRTCAFCGVTRKFMSRCGECKFKKYCSRVCQTKDWKRHKK